MREFKITEPKSHIKVGTTQTLSRLCIELDLTQVGRCCHLTFLPAAYLNEISRFADSEILRDSRGE